MIEALAAAVRSLSDRLRNLEAIPFNPYSPDADFFDHFAGDGTLDARWTTTLVLTGTVTLPNATPTYVRLSSGATAVSTAAIDWGTRQPLVGMAKAVDLRWRARYPLAVNANAKGLVGFRGPTVFTELALGVLGSSSAAFFVARSIDPAGPTITTTITTVPVDTAWHDWRIQTMPDRVRFYIDAVLVAEHIHAGAVVLPLAQPLMPYYDINNGATAADQQLDIDLIWVRENR